MYKKISLFLNKHRGIVMILCLGLIFRLVYFLIILHNYGNGGFYLTSNGDAVEYLSLAKQWLSSRTFQDLRGLPAPEIFRMPGYPLFIAFFYKIIPDVSLAILFQNVAFSAFIILFYKFSLRFFNKKIALLSSIFLAIEPSMIYWGSQLITETLFAIVVFLSVYCAALFYENKKIHWSAASGLLLALAIFIRPAGEYLFAVFILFYFCAWLFRQINFKKFILSALVAIAAFIFPLMPLMVRNKYFFGSFEISSSSNVGFKKYLTAINRQTGAEEILLGDNPLENSVIIKKNTITTILKHPLVFSKIYIISLAPFFLGDSYLSVFSMIDPRLEKQRVKTDWTGGSSELFSFLRGHKGVEMLIFFGGKIIWSCISIFALVGVFYWLRNKKNNYAMLCFFILLIVYFSLASGVGSYSRFRFPVNLYIFLFCALGIEWLRGFIKPPQVL